jgi:uncharacterized membrane protein
MRRFVHLDALRGIAIMLMTVDHAYDWWVAKDDRATAVWQAAHYLGFLAAPVFLYLVGVGLALSSARAAARGESWRSVALHMLRRGTALVAVGYLLNLVVYFVGDNVADIFAVDILQIIGVAIWLSIPLLWAPPLLLLAFLSAASCVGQTAGLWALPDAVAAYVTGNGGIGYFPLAVWLPFVWIGLLVGRWTCQQADMGWRMAALAGVGLGLFGLTAFVDSSWGYRHPRPAFVLFSVSVAFWLTAGLWLWTGKWARDGQVVRALSELGRSSLMLYVLHHLIGYRLFSLLGWVNGRSWRGQYGTLTLLPASGLFVALVAVMVLSSRWWCRRRPGLILARTR